MQRQSPHSPAWVRKEAMPQTNTNTTTPPRRFAHLSIAQLCARMNRAADFGYDDEAEELAHRLKGSGRRWRWTQSDPPRVEIYTVKEGAAK
jgi:hypothetical protein